MRLNGGVIGKSNQPTNRAAPGIWSSEEQRVSQLYGKFPKYYEGWDLTYLVNTTPRLLNTTTMSGMNAAAGMDFKPDGTVLYVLDAGSGGELSQYSLSTPWNTATASLSGSLASLPVQQGVAFRADGLAFFVGGSAAPPCRQYTMSTPWTVSTAVAGKLSPSIGSDSRGFTFSTDGMFMYVMQSGSSLRQYSLTTSFDVSTASFLRALSLSSTDNDMVGIFFKPDGLSFYVAGNQFNVARQYNLSTAWNISTVSSTTSTSITAGTSSPSNIFFKDDGTRMYVSTTNNISQFNLSTAWDITSASYSTQAFIVANGAVGTEGSITAFVFKPDGTRIFITGTTLDRVQELSIVTPWQIGTFTHVSTSAAVDTAPLGLFISSDGLRLYYSGNGVTRVVENELAPAYSLSGFSSGGFNINSSITDIAFSSDNTKFYALYTNLIMQYNLSGVGDLASYPITTLGTGGNAVFNFSGQTTGAIGLAFSSDGLCMYITTNIRVFKYNLLFPWAISSAIFAYSITNIPNSGSIKLKSDDSEMFITDATTVVRYSVPLAKELRSPGDEGGFFSVTTQEIIPTGLAFSPDGVNMYICGEAGDDVNQYVLSTPWNVTTASFVRLFSVATEEISSQSIRFKPDGTRMYIMGSTGDDINEYSLSTAWDISTASFVQLFSVNAQEANPNGLEFSPDGIHMYVTGESGDDVNQYVLSTAWNVSTASFVRTYDLAIVESTPHGIAFRPDGLRMYLLGTSGDLLYQYNLSTAWNVSTATFDKSLSIGYLDTSIFDLAFKSDGTKLYLVGATTDTIYELSLG